MKSSREKSPVIACTSSGTVYTLYTCPTNCRARVYFLYVNNISDTITLDVAIHKSLSAETFEILSGVSLGSGEVVQVSDEVGFILEAGDRFEVTCTGASVSATALCSAEEQFAISG